MIRLSLTHILMILLAKYRISRELNEEVLYRHEECTGNTGNLYVRYGYKKGRLGWFYQCKSCCGLTDGLRGFYPADKKTSPNETMEQLRNLMSVKAKDLIVAKIELPEDFTTKLSQQARAYMLKYDLSEDEIKLSRFGWSPILNRLIMPIYEGDNLQYWQGRNLGRVTTVQPKYKNLYTLGSRNIFALFKRRNKSLGSVKTLVIVEAIVSAIKISRHEDCLALLGSSLESPKLLDIIRAYARVIVWLDPDKKMVAIKGMNRLNALTGVPTLSCLTDKKPKQYNDTEILECLNSD